MLKLERIFLWAVCGVITVAALAVLVERVGYGKTASFSQTEPEFEVEEFGPGPMSLEPKLVALANWQRPAGPARVALQAGHWQVTDVPEELINLRSHTGAAAGAYTELGVNLDLAERTAEILQQQGVVVEVLPVTIPPGYWADAFVAIHADGNLDTTVSGFKLARARRDLSRQAVALAESVAQAYAAATGLPQDPNVTRNMRGYYAFNWRRYEHALHPMTPAIILEVGFITSAQDRRIIVGQPELAAHGIAQGILEFLSATAVRP